MYFNGRHLHQLKFTPHLTPGPGDGIQTFLFYQSDPRIGQGNTRLQTFLFYSVLLIWPQPTTWCSGNDLISGSSVWSTVATRLFLSTMYSLSSALLLIFLAHGQTMVRKDQVTQNMIHILEPRSGIGSENATRTTTSHIQSIIKREAKSRNEPRNLAMGRGIVD